MHDHAYSFSIFYPDRGTLEASHSGIPNIMRGAPDAFGAFLQWKSFAEMGVSSIIDACASKRNLLVGLVVQPIEYYRHD